MKNPAHTCESKVSQLSQKYLLQAWILIFFFFFFFEESILCLFYLHQKTPKNVASNARKSPTKHTAHCISRKTVLQQNTELKYLPQEDNKT